jgi:hypothetical protein
MKAIKAGRTTRFCKYAERVNWGTYGFGPFPVSSRRDYNETTIDPFSAVSPISGQK